MTTRRRLMNAREQKRWDAYMTVLADLQHRRSGIQSAIEVIEALEASKATCKASEA